MIYLAESNKLEEKGNCAAKWDSCCSFEEAEHEKETRNGEQEIIFLQQYAAILDYRPVPTLQTIVIK